MAGANAVGIVRIESIICPEGEDFIALMAASESAIKFWDNPADEIWNDE